MRPGDFDAWARAAIMEGCGGQCVGCGRTQPLNTQHRVARGMGGTSSKIIGHPSNGLILCGSGTTGCHGWTEAHPRHAELLGWRVNRSVVVEGWNSAPWWSKFGWRVYTHDLATAWLDDVDVPDLALRQVAISAYLDWRDDRHGV